MNQLCTSLWTSRFWLFIFWLIRSLFLALFFEIQCLQLAGSSSTVFAVNLILVASNCFNILDAKRAFCATPGLRSVSASIDSIYCNFCMVLSMFFTLVLAGTLFSLRDINLTLGLFSPRRHVVWRDSAGVRSSGSGIKSECTDIFSSEPDLWLLHHTDEPQREWNSCLWLQSRSVLSSFGVVLMSCRVNFHMYCNAEWQKI